MSKRFTETTKWDDAWFGQLSPKHKLLWCYLCDVCDHAGVWSFNQRKAEFEIGDSYDWHEVLTVFADRISVLPGGHKWYLPKFIKFQYPRGLSNKAPAQAWILRSIAAHGLPDPFEKEKKSINLPRDEVSHGDPIPMGYVSRKDTGDRKKDSLSSSGGVQRGIHDLGPELREWINQRIGGGENYIKTTALIAAAKKFGIDALQALCAHVTSNGADLTKELCQIWFYGRKSEYGGWDGYEPKKPLASPMTDEQIIDHLANTVS